MGGLTLMVIQISIVTGDAGWTSCVDRRVSDVKFNFETLTAGCY